MLVLYLPYVNATIRNVKKIHNINHNMDDDIKTILLTKTFRHLPGWQNNIPYFLVYWRINTVAPPEYRIFSFISAWKRSATWGQAEYFFFFCRSRHSDYYSTARKFPKWYESTSSSGSPVTCPKYANWGHCRLLTNIGLTAGAHAIESILWNIALCHTMTKSLATKVNRIFREDSLASIL